MIRRRGVLKGGGRFITLIGMEQPQVRMVVEKIEPSEAQPLPSDTGQMARKKKYAFEPKVMNARAGERPVRNFSVLKSVASVVVLALVFTIFLAMLGRLV